MVKVGDAVRLRPESDLRELLEPWTDAIWIVVETFQVDDDDGLRIAVRLDDGRGGQTAPLPADAFEPDRSSVTP